MNVRHKRVEPRNAALQPALEVFPIVLMIKDVLLFPIRTYTNMAKFHFHRLLQNELSPSKQSFVMASSR